MVDFSSTISPWFRAFFSSKNDLIVHYKWIVFGGNKSFYRKNDIFFYFPLLLKDKLFWRMSRIIGNISPSPQTGLHFLLVIWHFTRKSFCPSGFTWSPIKTKFIHMIRLYFGTTFPWNFSTHVSSFYINKHYLVIFLWYDLGFPHVEASSSHPC